ncbi:glycoside hydrolase family 6 protein [Streptomyces gobiensis]|nr:glycoside hydrolase family 6 protein [Streptomyces gobiensis]UGY93688.1 glycoside hydrolase family 6 protein [Streptomyces gobiensis]
MTLALALGCKTPASQAGAESTPPSKGAQAWQRKQTDFWVDPASDAARQIRQWEREGRTEDAEALKLLAEQAVAEWPSGDDPVPDVKTAVTSAAKTNSTAVLVAYNIPHRDCGQHSGGGATDGGAYRAYIDAFASAIGDHPAIVILEPDAVPHIVDGCTPGQYHDERYQLLKEAVDRLRAQSGVKVYLDAGNPGWIKDPGQLAEPLRRSGMAVADGFALNVSNFHTDDDVIVYGRKLSESLDGKHFVIDSSRNGNGPLTGRADAWCNPPGRALGTPPTTDTGDPLLDAYLWIKRPGESDGECRGGPPAGRWWAEYALGLVRNVQR